MWDSEPEQQGHHAEGNTEREEENERHAPMQKIAALDSGAPDRKVFDYQLQLWVAVEWPQGHHGDDWINQDEEQDESVPEAFQDSLFEGLVRLRQRGHRP
mmetsp:Transcript_107058/g.160040  ORF Transcript_107058/g.160040 Transcript_107058/m.160040 type:complete len:100 (+) Transcript_107058:577-876(+)